MHTLHWIDFAASFDSVVVVVEEEEKRERKKERERQYPRRKSAQQVQFVLDNTHKERERNALSMLPPPAFAIFARAFSLAFADFCPFPPPIMKLLSSSSKRIVVDPPSRRAFSTSMRSPFCKVSSSPPFGI